MTTSLSNDSTSRSLHSENSSNYLPQYFNSPDQASSYSHKREAGALKLESNQAANSYQTQSSAILSSPSNQGMTSGVNAKSKSCNDGAQNSVTPVHFFFPTFCPTTQQNYFQNGMGGVGGPQSTHSSQASTQNSYAQRRGGKKKGAQIQCQGAEQRIFFNLRRRDQPASNQGKVHSQVYKPKVVPSLPEWFASLSCEERVLALSTVCISMVELLVNMNRKQELNRREYMFAEIQQNNNSQEKQYSQYSYPQQYIAQLLQSQCDNQNYIYQDPKTANNNDKNSKRDSQMSFEEMFYSKERNDMQMGYEKDKIQAEKELLKHIIILDFAQYCDTLSVDQDLVSNPDRFFLLMKACTQQKAFTQPCKFDNQEHSVEDPYWFRKQSFHSMADWIVAALEQNLWVHYNYENNVNLGSFKLNELSGLFKDRAESDFFEVPYDCLVQFWKTASPKMREQLQQKLTENSLVIYKAYVEHRKKYQEAYFKSQQYGQLRLGDRSVSADREALEKTEQDYKQELRNILYLSNEQDSEHILVEYLSQSSLGRVNKRVDKICREFLNILKHKYQEDLVENLLKEESKPKKWGNNGGRRKKKKNLQQNGAALPQLVVEEPLKIDNDEESAAKKQKQQQKKKQVFSPVVITETKKDYNSQVQSKKKKGKKSDQSFEETVTQISSQDNNGGQLYKVTKKPKNKEFDDMSNDSLKEQHRMKKKQFTQEEEQVINVYVKQLVSEMVDKVAIMNGESDSNDDHHKRKQKKVVVEKSAFHGIGIGEGEQQKQYIKKKVPHVEEEQKMRKTSFNKQYSEDIKQKVSSTPVLIESKQVEQQQMDQKKANHQKQNNNKQELQQQQKKVQHQNKQQQQEVSDTQSSKTNDNNDIVKKKRNRKKGVKMNDQDIMNSFMKQLQSNSEDTCTTENETTKNDRNHHHKRNLQQQQYVPVQNSKKQQNVQQQINSKRQSVEEGKQQQQYKPKEQKPQQQQQLQKHQSLNVTASEKEIKTQQPQQQQYTTKVKATPNSNTQQQQYRPRGQFNGFCRNTPNNSSSQNEGEQKINQNKKKSSQGQQQSKAFKHLNFNSKQQDWESETNSVQTSSSVHNDSQIVDTSHLPDLKQSAPQSQERKASDIKVFAESVPEKKLSPVPSQDLHLVYNYSQNQTMSAQAEEFLVTPGQVQSPISCLSMQAQSFTPGGMTYQYQGQQQQQQFFQNQPVYNNNGSNNYYGQQNSFQIQGNTYQSYQNTPVKGSTKAIYQPKAESKAFYPSSKTNNNSHTNQQQQNYMTPPIGLKHKTFGNNGNNYNHQGIQKRNSRNDVINGKKSPPLNYQMKSHKSTVIEDNFLPQSQFAPSYQYQEFQPSPSFTHSYSQQYPQSQYQQLDSRSESFQPQQQPQQLPQQQQQQDYMYFNQMSTLSPPQNILQFLTQLTQQSPLTQSFLNSPPIQPQQYFSPQGDFQLNLQQNGIAVDQKTQNQAEGKFFQKLDVDIQQFIANIKMNLDLLEPERNYVLQKIQETAQRVFPNQKPRVIKFGSLTTGLALESSDMDIAITDLNIQDRYAMITEMGKLSNELQQWQCSESFKFIDTASIPVIKMKIDLVKLREKDLDKMGNDSIEFLTKIIPEDQRILQLDITFDDSSPPPPSIHQDSYSSGNGFIPNAQSPQQHHKTHLGLESCYLVQQFISEYPNLKEVAILLKKFLAIHSLNSPYYGGLSSYSTVLLIVAYMNYFKLKNVNSQQTPSQLLMGFLDFYGNYFNPSTLGINVINDGSFYHQLGTLSLTDSNFVILDPLNLQNNTTRNSYLTSQILKTFETAFNNLKSMILKACKTHNITSSSSSSLQEDAGNNSSNQHQHHQKNSKNNNNFLEMATMQQQQQQNECSINNNNNEAEDYSKQHNNQQQENIVNLSNSITLSDALTNIESIKGHFAQVINSLEQNIAIDLGIPDTQPTSITMESSCARQQVCQMFEGVNLLDIFFAKEPIDQQEEAVTSGNQSQKNENKQSEE